MQTEEEIDKDMLTWSDALARRKTTSGGSGGVVERSVSGFEPKGFRQRADVNIEWIGDATPQIFYRSSHVHREKTGTYYEGAPNYKVWLKAFFTSPNIIAERVLKIPDTDPCNTWEIDGYTDFTTTAHCYTELEYCAGNLIREYHDPAFCTHPSASGLDHTENEYTTALLISRALAKISFPPNFGCAVPPPLPPNQGCATTSRRLLWNNDRTIDITRVQFRFTGGSGTIHWTERTVPDVGTPTTVDKMGTFNTTYTLMEPSVNGYVEVINYHT